MDLMRSALCIVDYYTHYKRVITCAVQVKAITAKAKEKPLTAFFISFTVTLFDTKTGIAQ
jgi:hypothetical protein